MVQFDTCNQHIVTNMPVAALTCNARPVEAKHFDSSFKISFKIINFSYFGSFTLDLLIIIFLKQYVHLDFIVTVTLIMCQLNSDFTCLRSNLSNRFQPMDFWKKTVIQTWTWRETALFEC